MRLMQDYLNTVMALSQEHEVGVKWKTKRSCRSSQARTLGCLWAA
jgi:hypothetical protein